MVGSVGGSVANGAGGKSGGHLDQPQKHGSGDGGESDEENPCKDETSSLKDRAELLVR
jgi:hypothetical protein